MSTVLQGQQKGWPERHQTVPEIGAVAVSRWSTLACHFSDVQFIAIISILYWLDMIERRLVFLWNKCRSSLYDKGKKMFGTQIPPAPPKPLEYTFPFTWQDKSLSQKKTKTWTQLSPSSYDAKRSKKTCSFSDSYCFLVFFVEAIQNSIRLGLLGFFFLYQGLFFYFCCDVSEAEKCVSKAPPRRCKWLKTFLRYLPTD